MGNGNRPTINGNQPTINGNRPTINGNQPTSNGNQPSTFIDQSINTGTVVRSGQCEEDNTVYFMNNLCGGSGADGRPCSTETTKERCAASCQDEMYCQFWSWHKSSGRCYLKSKRENVQTNNQYTSGCKSANMYNTGTSSSSSMDRCMSDCNDNAR